MDPKRRTPVVDKQQLEQQWVNHEARTSLSKTDYALWQGLQSTHRLYMGVSRTLFVWTFERDRPVPVYALELEGLQCSFKRGLSATFSHPEGLITVSQEPVRPPKSDCFLWLPAFSEIRWAPSDYEVATSIRVLTVAVCVKLPSNPKHGLLEGRSYVNTVPEFRQLWPNYKDLKF